MYMKKFKTTEKIIQDFKLVWGDRYDYSQITSPVKGKVVIICKEHGLFKLYPYKHVKGVGCYKCGRISAGQKNRVALLNTTEKFIEKAKKRHDDKYDYSISIYTHSHAKIKIICPLHGQFEQSASTHLEGFGCKKCQYEKKSYDYRKFKNEEDIEKIINERSKGLIKLKSITELKFNRFITIECKIHGESDVRLDTVIKNKICCKQCNKEAIVKKSTKTTENYINECILVHGDKYDYSKTVYIHSHKKTTFTCKKHGDFEQYVGAHLAGSGCPKCIHRISKPALKWIKSLNNANIIMEKRIEGKYVDGYDPTTNTVYEFYGDYWHGNPKIFHSSTYNKRTKCTMGTLYQKTTNRAQFLKFKGYNIIEMWESDFKFKD